MKPTLTTQLKIIFVLVAMTLALLVGLHSTAMLSYAEPEPAAKESGAPDREFRRERKDFRDDMRQRREERGGDRDAGGRGPDGQRGPGEGRPDRPGGRAAHYLEIVQSYQAAIQDPHQAVGLAVLGLKESYRKQGNPTGAVKELEEFLETTHDPKMRNILLFGIRQIYEEDHNAEKFNETNKRIIKENLNGGK